MLKKTSKLLLVPSALLCAGLFSQSASAGMKFELNDGKDTFEVGGYFKLDARYVTGDVAYTSFWMGANATTAVDTSTFKLTAQESRFNFKYTHGNVMGFMEWDMINPATRGGSGAENFTNRYQPDLRHAFIMYKPGNGTSWLMGQSWSTLVNTSAFMETLSFGGPLHSMTFVRQGQIRYTNGGFQVALENPKVFGAAENDDTNSVPDLIVRYNTKGKWGNVSFSGLVRSIDAVGISETAIGVSVAGRIKAGARDDFRFVVSAGELGRYVGLALATDVAGGDLEETFAYQLGYRHFWKDSWRSNFFYGRGETDNSDKTISLFGVNILKNVTKELTMGFEIGNYDMQHEDADSTYLQFSAKYAI
ncbi:MAG: hypothetical protein ACI8WB_005462 [Phenylobacterium sp.]|jgi:hypothetical protein